MISAVEARTLARSVFEARREGRKLKPLTNTRLLSVEDAITIQDALIELRLANGEVLLGWGLVDGEQVAPIMTSNLIDDRVVMGIPSRAVDVRVEPVVVISDVVRLGMRAIDRLMTGALTEDLVSSGHGLVSVVQGEELSSGDFEIRTSRTKHSVSVDRDAIRTQISRLLLARGRTLGNADLLTSAALLPGDPLARGQEALLQAFVNGAEARCLLRHL